MASRLNKRFILIVSLIIFVLGVGVAGVAYVMISGDADRQVRLGKAAEERGDIKEALGRYGRAIGKDPRNLEYYDHFEQALFKIVPQTSVEAVERFNRQYITLLERRRAASVDNPDSWVQLLDVYTNRAQVFDVRNNAGMWGDVQEHAQRMVDQFDTGDPEDQEALDLARVVRLNSMSMRTGLLKPDEEQIFEDDSTELMESLNKDPRLWEAVMRVRLEEAQQHSTRGDDRLLRRTLTDADDSFDNIHARMMELDVEPSPQILGILFIRAGFDSPEIAEEKRNAIRELVQEKIRSLGAQLLAQSSGRPDPDLQSELRLYAATNTLESEQAVELLTPLLEEDLLPLGMNMMICQNFVMNHPQFASLAAERTLQMDPLPVSLQAMFQKEARGEAALALFDAAYVERARQDLEITQSGSNVEPDVTVAELESLKEIALREFEGEPNYEAVDLYLEGSILLVKEDAAAARSMFLEMSRSDFAKRGDMRFRYLPRLIASAVLSGERGAALQQLQTFVNQLPPNQGANLRLTIASELMELGRMEAARSMLQSVIAMEPDNEEAREMLAEVQRLSDSGIGNPLRSKTDRQYGRVRAAIAEGRLSDARNLLSEFIEETDDPAYKRLLVLVNIELGDNEEALRVASTVENAEEDPNLQRILSRITIENPVERTLMISESSYDDPASRAASDYILLQRLAGSGSQGHEEAASLLGEVREAALANIPDDPILHQRLIAAAIIEDSPQEGGGRSIAAQFLEAIAEVETDEVEFSNLKAVVINANEGPAACIEFLKPIIDRGIANAETWFVIGLCYRELGLLDDSVDSLRRSVERSPENPRYISWYTMALEQAGEPTKALAVLRQSQMAPATRASMLDAWITAESRYGEKRVALKHRRNVYESDLAESADQTRPIIQLGNALEFARLLLVTDVDRSDLLNRQGSSAYTPAAWGRMSGAERRRLLGIERDQRKKVAFEVLDMVEKTAGDDGTRASAMIARASALLLLGDMNNAREEILEVIRCCDESIGIDERFKLVDVLSLMQMQDQLKRQFTKLEELDSPQDLRRAVSTASFSPVPESAVGLSRVLYEKTGLPSDRIRLVRAQLAVSDLDAAEQGIDELLDDEEANRNEFNRYEIKSLEASLQGFKGNQLILSSQADVKNLADATSRKDQAAIDRYQADINAKQAEAREYFDNCIELAEECHEMVPNDPTPLILKHSMLRSKMMIGDDSAVEADMVENARRARSLAPMEWRTNRALVQSYIMTSQPKEAIASLDQYFQRGGIDDEARRTFVQLAETEGSPGIAIPSLKVAMQQDSTNPAWPRSIAYLLRRTGDLAAASEMWWKVLELDNSPQAIDAFVDLEFRRPKPNMARLREVFELIPEDQRTRPELRGAQAVVFANEGDIRRSDLMMRDAYIAAKKEVETGQDPIVVDRVLTYFFKLKPGESLTKSEERLRELSRGELGAHEYGALASKAMEGGTRSNNLEEAKKYLRLAADKAGNELTYKKALLHQLATVLYLSDDCDGSVRALQEVISLGDPQPSTLNNLAYMLVDCRNDPETAIVYSTQAVRMAGTSASFLDTHGYVLFKLGRMDEAERFLVRAITITPSVSNLLHLAEVMQATGRSERAEVLIQKIGKDFPQVTPDQQKKINELISTIG